eukprot:8634728-Pyramimonas_sp.AAC.1
MELKEHVGPPSGWLGARRKLLDNKMGYLAAVVQLKRWRSTAKRPWMRYWRPYRAQGVWNIACVCMRW